MTVYQVRSRAPVELMDAHRLLGAVKDETTSYLWAALGEGDEYHAACLAVRDAHENTPFSAVIPSYDLMDGLALRHQAAQRFGVPEGNLPKPRESQARTYTFGDAVRDLRIGAGIEA